MTRRLSVLSRSWVGIVVVGLQTSSDGQDESRGLVLERSRGAEAVLAESTPLVLAGWVVGPDGTPVEGALVASSAGGEARSDARGQFRLEVPVPLGAESLQLSAVGTAAGARLRARAQIPIPGSNPALSGPLVLELGAACQPSWEPTFGGQPGTGALNFQGIRVYCFTTFDDGSGRALYVGGGFPTAGGVEAIRIAKWDGSSWAALPVGFNERVRALAEFDDGSGPALYAGGLFHGGGGAQPNFVAKWNGSSWSPLGSPANGTNGSVFALAVHDDRSGTALYVGGSFSTAGGMPANGIARWNGSTWSALGSGMLSVLSLAVHDDGSGPALYAGGIFTTAGGVPANWIARWDGSTWSAVGTGMNLPVRALTVHDDGGGPALYAGGDFTLASGGAASHVAKWDGSSWSALGAGTNGAVWALTTFDDGGGSALYAAGSFVSAGGLVVNRIAKWLVGPRRRVERRRLRLGGVRRRWRPGALRGRCLHGGGRRARELHRALGRHELVSAGHGDEQRRREPEQRRRPGGVRRRRRSGALRRRQLPHRGRGVCDPDREVEERSLVPVDRPGSGLNGVVHALTVFDDGGGPALYAGGLFLRGGGVVLNRVGKWDGTGWSALGSGMSDDVRTLAGYDDGGGPALFAGGEFFTAGGVAARRIARWDGASWSPLGSGLGSSFAVWSSSGPDVAALVVFDDGCGPSLYAGGAFESVSDSRDSFLARWRGCDTVPPVLSCPAEVLVVDARDDAPGAIVDFLVTASDGCQPDPSVLCVPPSGSFFPRGTTTVACTATDAEGNQASCSFPVVVSLPPRARVR